MVVALIAIRNVDEAERVGICHLHLPIHMALENRISDAKRAP